MQIVFSRYGGKKKSRLRKVIGNIRSDMAYRNAVLEAEAEFKSKVLPLPWSIEVETINRCNNDCSFCPVNRNQEQRPFLRMSDSLLNKILDELHSIDYAGIVQLFSNNEPLMDKEIYSRYKVAREKVPNAYMLMMSNGIMIKTEHIDELLDNLDMLVIDNYSDDLQMIPEVRELYEWVCDKPEYQGKVEIHIRKKNEVLTSRGG